METMDTLDEGLQENDISQTVVEQSAATSTWVKIVAICGIAGAVISLISSLIIMGVQGIGSVIGTGISVALYVTLLAYGNSLTALGNSGNSHDFTDAMRKQKTYWMFLGILLIIGLVIFLIAVMIIGANIEEFGHELEDAMEEIFERAM